MKSRLVLPAGALLALTMTLQTACSTGAAKQTPLMEEVGVEDVTTRELQVMVYGFGWHCAGTLELAAQKIQDNADSPEVRQNAILWKMNAVPVIYQAVFNNYPLGGLTSVWGFCVQMRMFLTTGAGKNLFGDWQDIAVESARELETAAEELTRSIVVNVDFTLFQEGMERYARNHPIDNLLFVRRGDSMEFFKRVAGTSAGGLAAAASMNEEMQMLSDRMAILTVTVPKQVQWHTELMLAQAPEFIAEQRDSTIAALQNESWEMLKPLMLYLEEVRKQVTADFTEERMAVLAGIASERIAVLEALGEERNVVLERIGAERNLTLEQLSALTLSSIEQMMQETGELSKETADHIFWRAFQLLALPFLALLVICIVVLLMIRDGINRYMRLMAAGKGRDHSGAIE